MISSLFSCLSQIEWFSCCFPSFCLYGMNLRGDPEGEAQMSLLISYQVCSPPCPQICCLSVFPFVLWKAKQPLISRELCLKGGAQGIPFFFHIQDLGEMPSPSTPLVCWDKVLCAVGASWNPSLSLFPSKLSIFMFSPGDRFMAPHDFQGAPKTSVRGREQFKAFWKIWMSALPTPLVHPPLRFGSSKLFFPPSR